jgi:checkpoint serine/threonine-protein kinase
LAFSAFCIQSLPQITYSQISNPAKEQVTINAKGRTERIFVDLESVYPTPDEIGTELSFEELRAAKRGWLTKVWVPESRSMSSDSGSKDTTGESHVNVENLSRDVSEKLVIARDPPMLDENGASKEHSREGRGRRMKIKEVNATQISES